MRFEPESRTQRVFGLEKGHRTSVRRDQLGSPGTERGLAEHEAADRQLDRMSCRQLNGLGLRQRGRSRRFKLPKLQGPYHAK